MNHGLRCIYAILFLYTQEDKILVMRVSGDYQIAVKDSLRLSEQKKQDQRDIEKFEDRMLESKRTNKIKIFNSACYISSSAKLIKINMKFNSCNSVMRDVYFG